MNTPSVLLGPAATAAAGVFGVGGGAFGVLGVFADDFGVPAPCMSFQCCRTDSALRPVPSFSAISAHVSVPLDLSVVNFFSSFSSQNTPRVDDTFGVRAGEVALRGIDR